MLKEMLQNANDQVLKQYLEDIHAHDLSELFLDLDYEERQRLYRSLSDEKLADLVSYLDAEEAAEIFTDFNLKKQKQLVELMEPDDAVDIIQELEDDHQDELLDILGESSDIVQLIHYGEDETGSAMTNLVVVVHPDLDVKQATKKVIQEAVDVESINTIFVTDEENHYLGVVPLKKLLKAKTPCQISEVMEEYPFAYASDSITQTVQSIRNYAIYEMPVINENHVLLGMITLDDALDIYQEEAQEDFERLAGLPETMPDSSALKSAFHRLPWLLALLCFLIPIALVTSAFEHILATVAILIIFQPLILDSAGNVATQTLAVTLKMLSTNEKGMLKNSYREIITGMINGLVIGFVAFAVTFAFAHLNTSLTSEPVLVSFVVGVSLWLTVLTAPLIAIIIPLTLKAIKVDPAVASGPFITTFIDVVALFIYFGLATIMLGGL
ncbi:magnesium transporter [Peloplasma aerotolerans]|jgi:magnesium transporter|uniref:Magnesium transporter MgtE n=1 Tax=Peloplasma aerotolerans TaxID=3044389 RepID=A0AAW6U9J9_9MOLU|nr:magnesium transporter [Mariniplasma sp. M4Ah]MDI6452629.1 magnesium transporter [Mariniplasma sp. M4Ah]